MRLPSTSTVLAAVLALLSQTQLSSALDLRGRVSSSKLVPKDDSTTTKRELLQNIVTWDNQSLLINGERLMMYSGEFHPFRLPVPSLWLDVFQKMKALGLNMASFYVDWALVEGKPGNFSAEGIFDLTGFFSAAKEAGIYLNARPGPYINAEASGGGFPGWLQRIQGHLRTSAPDYLAATDNYAANIAAIIAKAQITNGGPIILYQPENEYTGADSDVLFPDPYYMQYVEDQARNAGVVIPLMSNDAGAEGHNAPGTGEGEVDIYGHDSYPLGFDCSDPTSWPAGYLPTDFRADHVAQSPTTPYAIPEFQGGSYDPWGGPGFASCVELLNQEFVRVFNKNDYAAGIRILSLYMIFGGTNWGNIGHPGGYTSYDYAAAIAEDRTVTREKYSELKLEAQFLKASPGYLLATPAISNMTGVYSTNTAITVTSLTGPEGSFFVVRHTDYQSTDTTTYTITLPTTTLGNVTLPQLGGSLTLSRRDSKIHVTDYPVGSRATLVYSTAEIFTWQEYANQTVLVVYGGDGETHEMAITTPSSAQVVLPSGSPAEEESFTVHTKNAGNTTVVIAQWKTTTTRRILQLSNGLFVYIVDRNSAYNYWVPELAGAPSLIINGGYLIRTASVGGSTLNLQADFNATTTLEIIGIPSSVSSLSINGANIDHTTNSDGNWVADPGYLEPSFSLPDLATLDWMSIDSLPEVQADYDDSLWTAADHNYTNNTFVQPFLTPVSLYGSDYGFNVGTLLFRAYFTATGSESAFYVDTQGGTAFASAVWLNGTFLGSWTGDAATSASNNTYTLPPLTAGQIYVITIVVDTMGLDENWTVGSDEMKDARGILDYGLLSGTSTATTTPLTWKITGNLGGEDYVDRVRGPLNEGGLFVERMGYTQPSPPLDQFVSGSSPYQGFAGPGITFYTAKLTLDLPSAAYDIPLSFTFTNNTDSSSTTTDSDFRAWLFVNGFQFGRYVSYIGPQTAFPVPEGILNYQGDNWIGLVVFAPGTAGAKVPGFELTAGVPVMTGRQPVQLVEAPAWTARPGAY